MRLYAVVAVGAFRRIATYRIATVAGVFTNTVFGFIMAYTYIALWDERPHLGGYDQAQALTYVWMGQALLTTMAMMGGGFEDELIERIRTGDIAIDLYRPVDLNSGGSQATWAGQAFHLLGRGVLPMAFGALAFDLALPSNPFMWCAVLLSLVLGVLRAARELDRRGPAVSQDLSEQLTELRELCRVDAGDRRPQQFLARVAEQRTAGVVRGEDAAVVRVHHVGGLGRMLEAGPGDEVVGRVDRGHPACEPVLRLISMCWWWRRCCSSRLRAGEIVSLKTSRTSW